MAGAKSSAPKEGAESPKVPSTDGSSGSGGSGNETASDNAGAPTGKTVEELLADRKAEEQALLDAELAADRARVEAEQKAIDDRMEAERQTRDRTLRRIDAVSRDGVTRVRVWPTGSVLWNGRMLEAGTVVEIDQATHSHDEFMEQVEAGRFLPPKDEE